MTRKILTSLSMTLILVLCFSLAGCPKIEKDAYLAATGAKAFLDSVKSKHPECNQPNTTGDTCDYLRKAIAAKDVLIDAGEIYCGSAVFDNGGACTPPDKKSPAYQTAQDKLRAALQSYEQVEKDLRTVLSKGAQ
jgi:hypothetical protein